jgi:hypothetical protein
MTSSGHRIDTALEPSTLAATGCRPSSCSATTGERANRHGPFAEEPADGTSARREMVGAARFADSAEPAVCDEPTPAL